MVDCKTNSEGVSWFRRPTPLIGVPSQAQPLILPNRYPDSETVAAPYESNTRYVEKQYLRYPGVLVITLCSLHVMMLWQEAVGILRPMGVVELE